MCGIFGFAATLPGKSIDLSRLCKIATGAEARGPHAWGVSYVLNGRLMMFKQPGRITTYLDRLCDMVTGASMLIGHCRWATHGHPSDNSTNHPHPCDGGWLVHNGQIEASRQMIRDMDLCPVSECDSELICSLAVTSEGTIANRLGYALEYAQAYGDWRRSHAVAWLGSRPSQLCVVRAGKPVFASKYAHGVYFASTTDGLGRNSELPNNHAISFRYRSGKLVVSTGKVNTIDYGDGNRRY